MYFEVQANTIEYIYVLIPISKSIHKKSSIFGNCNVDLILTMSGKNGFESGNLISVISTYLCICMCACKCLY